MTTDNREQAAKIAARLREALRTRLATFGAQTGMTVDVQELTSKDIDQDADYAPMKIVESESDSCNWAVYSGPDDAPRFYKGRRASTSFYKLVQCHDDIRTCGKNAISALTKALADLRSQLLKTGAPAPSHAYVLFLQNLTVHVGEKQPEVYCAVGLIVSGPEN